VCVGFVCVYTGVRVLVCVCVEGLGDMRLECVNGVCVLDLCAMLTRFVDCVRVCASVSVEMASEAGACACVLVACCNDGFVRVL